jgi:type I restriction enzyme M protein
MDYLYLLQCLAFLRLYDQGRWARLTRRVPADGDPGTARLLMRCAVAAVDAALGRPDLLCGSDAPPARLRPRAFEPVRKVIELTAYLRTDDFQRLRAAFVREVRVRIDAICTPTNIASTMVALLANNTVQGEVTVYDPFARFGELLTEFVQDHPDPAAVRVHAEHPRPAELRLAAMWLAAAGARAELAVTPSPPPGGARFVLTNPPFGNHGESAWLRRCIASLAPGGRAAVLLPYNTGFDSGSRARDVRRDLVEHGAVLAVVALPARMFPGISIGVCVWLLRQPTGHAAPIQFVDARPLGRPSRAPALGLQVLGSADIATIAATVAASERRPGFSIVVAPHEIRAHGYSLHPPEYQDRTVVQAPTDAARSELDTLFDDLDPPSYTTGDDEGWPRRPLRELCDIRTGVPHGTLKAAVSRAPAARERVPVVHPRHLRDGLIKASDVPYADTTSLERYRLQANDVLWVRTGAMGQTAIVHSGESGWLPHTNLFRLRVTNPSELDPAYLLAYLSQAPVQARIRDRSIRSVTTSLNTTTFGGFEIPVPPLADQKKILAAIEALDEQAATIERRLAAARAARIALSRHLTDGTIVLTEREAQ